MPAGFAATPEPPYYAVIFTARRTAGDDGYAAMAQAMVDLALKQPGFRLASFDTRGPGRAAQDAGDTMAMRSLAARLRMRETLWRCGPGRAARCP